MLVLVQFDYEVMIREQSFLSLVVSQQKGVSSAKLELDLVSMMELVKLFLAEDLLEHEQSLFQTFQSV